MGDDLQITHGGVIEVDPDALRAVADGMLALARRYADAAASVREARGWLWRVPDAWARVDAGALEASAARADELHAECTSAAGSTRLMADVYELVERRQEQAALQIRDGAAAARLDARIDELIASDERVAEMEQWLMADWEEHRYDGLDEPPTVLGGVPIPGSRAAQGIIRRIAALGSSGAGRVPPGATLRGSGGPVAVSVVTTSTGGRTSPPGGIADALRRIDAIEGGQIRVEKYEMPDGTNRFMLYEKGTQMLQRADEPFDFESNLDLYQGEESASYAATVEALVQAGAMPGDRVDVVAHSQAAMNAAYLATGSEFDVKVQVTAGGPVRPTLDPDHVLVALAHRDDLVAALAGGGLPGGSGGADSVVISRVADPRYGIDQAGIGPHMLDSYIETAEMADASGDVRLQAIQVDWDELREATAVTTTDFEATRG